MISILLFFPLSVFFLTRLYISQVDLEFILESMPGLELLVLLYQLSECWDYHVSHLTQLDSSHPFVILIFLWTLNNCWGLEEETQVPYYLPGICMMPPRYPWEMKMSLKLASSPSSELQALVTGDTAPHFCVLWRLLG